MLNKNKKRIQASAIVYALVIMFVVSIIFTSMIGYITSQIKFSLNRVEKEKALQIAESGIYYYKWYLAHKTSGKTAEQIIDFWKSGSPLGVDSPYEADFEGIGKYSIDVDPPESDSTIVTVRSTGWTYKEPGLKRTVQVRFRRPSWSEYIFLSDAFLHFGTESEVYGKVHSNNGIHFDGIAHNTVSSLLPTCDDPNLGGEKLEFGVYTHSGTDDPSPPTYPVPSRPDVFMGGREFPVSEVSFSGVTADLASMKTEALGDNGNYYNETGKGRRIILKEDGNYDICTVDNYHHTSFSISKYRKTDNSGTCNTCSGDCLSNFKIPDGGIIFVENDIWVNGVVNGDRVTIVAANLSGGGDEANIYIGFDDDLGVSDNGNLRYTNYDCDNIIGLIAQKDITVVRFCPSDFVIDAAIMAQGGRVEISNSMGNQNSITFNGAITSYLSPYFGSGINGFADRVFIYDNNLLYCPPPHFPTGTEYSLDLWEEL